MKRQFAISTLLTFCSAILLALSIGQSVSAQAPEVIVTKSANGILNYIIDPTKPQATTRKRVSVAEANEQAKRAFSDLNIPEPLAIQSDRSVNNSIPAAPSQVIINGSAPPFIAKASCLFCKRGKDFSLSLLAFETFNLPGVKVEWRLYRPGTQLRYLVGDGRVTYGVLRNSAYPGHVSYVSDGAEYNDAIVVPLGDDSDTTNGEYILQFIVREWGGKLLQVGVVPFYVDMTPEPGRGVEAVDTAIGYSDGFLTIYGRFLIGVPYDVWVGNSDRGGFGRVYSTDGLTLRGPVGSLQLEETQWDVVVYSPTSLAHLTAPGGVVMKRYVRPPQPAQIPQR